MTFERRRGTTSETGGAQSDAFLEVIDLEAGYGASRVLFGVNLRVRCGEVVALLGRNGAGKSTTLKALMGMLPPSAGRVVFAGRDVSRWPPHLIARAGMGFVPQDRRIFPDLTVRENLEVGRQAGHRTVPGWDEDRVGRLFPALAALGDRRGESLSGGEQQMLAIARTLMGNPRVLLLDEPSEGLAPLVVKSLAAQVLQLKAEGVTILLSEQSIHVTALVSDRAYVLEKGLVKHEGDMSEIMRDPAVIGKYLRV